MESLKNFIRETEVKLENQEEKMYLFSKRL